jgi:hypothetical protein
MEQLAPDFHDELDFRNTKARLSYESRAFVLLKA